MELIVVILVVILLLSEPFLAQESQKAEFVRSPRNSEFDAAREYLRSWTPAAPKSRNRGTQAG